LVLAVIGKRRNLLRRFCRLQPEIRIGILAGTALCLQHLHREFAMTQRVLVAVDGTPASNKALEIACALADKHDAGLGLIYVTEPAEVSDQALRVAVQEGVLRLPDSSFSSNIYPFGVSSIAEDAQRGAYFARLSDAMADSVVAEAKAFSEGSAAKAIKTFVRSGDIAGEILDVATSEKADLIVMGHDQIGRLKALIKGSVAEKVQRLAPCPCLIYCLPAKG
jgi:nucleotide-binding universal stress UspA family protein